MKHIHTQQRGFTLIELMIVVVVVAILTAIAYPSYAAYIRRGHRAEARAGLYQAQQWLERAATAQGTYPSTLPAALTWTGDAAKRYTIALETNTEGTTFILTAKRKPGTDQAEDQCGDYTLTHTGKQGNLLPSGGSMTEDGCWRQ